MGIPYRIVVSKRSLADGGFEIKKRNEPNGKIVNKDELMDILVNN
jgi:prolyl-tRNA synthetase